MHISEVSLVNYRNFKSAKVILKSGVNTIIGENGSGKSNLFRAIRLLLDENLVGRSHQLDDADFHRGLGDWRGHWIVLTLEFDDLSNDEAIQSLILQRTAEEKSGVTAKATYTLMFRPRGEIRDRFAQLADGDHLGLFELQNEISIDDYERILLGKTNVDLTLPDEYLRIVGDFENVKFPRDEENRAPSFADELGIKIPRELSLWREFAFTYIPALRDVVADFSDVRRNPLRTLLTAKSNEISDGELEEILGLVRDLNTQIEAQEDVNDLTSGIQHTFRNTVGETFSPTSMKIKSELPLEASDLFKSLKLYVGENGDEDPRRLHEMSLGGANLVYLTLKLLEFQYRTARKAVANFLLIEEPERPTSILTFKKPFLNGLSMRIRRSSTPLTPLKSQKLARSSVSTSCPVRAEPGPPFSRLRA